MVALGLSEPVSAASVERESNQILRFRASERHLHWAVAIPFKVCYATALILVTVYNPNPTRPLREVVSWVHRLSGVCLAVLPLATIIWHRHEFWMHLQNVRRAWRWRIADIKWLFLMGPATIDKRIELPHQDKFNAAEKINFMVLTATYPMYVATGLTIWFFNPAFVSWLIHFSMATIATPLVFGHIFMATINPDTRVGLSGMITGWVDRHWAKHHYRLWYDELFGTRALDAERPRPAARPAVQPVTRPAAQPVTRPAIQPVARPAARPVARPATVPAPRPTLVPPPPVRQPAAARPAAVEAGATRHVGADTEWILRPVPAPAGSTTLWSLRPPAKERQDALPPGNVDPSFAS